MCEELESILNKIVQCNERISKWTKGIEILRQYFHISDYVEAYKEGEQMIDEEKQKRTGYLESCNQHILICTICKSI